MSIKLMKNKLLAPSAYFKMTAKEKAEICNGMGAKDSLLAKFIPNTMYGLNVIEAGNRHDFGYYIGKTEEDKTVFDLELLWNLLCLIINEGGWLAIPRMFRALAYFIAVHYKGHDAFWKNKTGNKDDN